MESRAPISYLAQASPRRDVEAIHRPRNKARNLALASPHGVCNTRTEQEMKNAVSVDITDMAERKQEALMRIVKILAAVLCVGLTLPGIAHGLCQVKVVSSIAPTDGGTATPPALLTPSTAGVPAALNGSSTSEILSQLLFYDDGLTQTCFVTGQTFKIVFNVAITPTTISANNVDVYDSAGAASGMTVSVVPTANQSQTTVTVTVGRPGTLGDPTTGAVGSG